MVNLAQVPKLAESLFLRESEARKLVRNGEYAWL